MTADAEGHDLFTRYLHVTRQSHQAPAKSTVLVRENAAGAIELRYRGRLMRWTEIAASVLRPPAVRTRRSSAPHRPAGPSADHPWRRDMASVFVDLRQVPVAKP